MQDYILGHTGFPQQNPGKIIVYGSATAWNFQDITYQIDKNNGAGFSSWHNFKIPRTFTGVSAQYTLTCSSTTGMEVGDYIGGQVGIAGETKITIINSATVVTVDKANVATIGTGPAWLTQLASETSINAEKGFKLKIRMKTIATNTSNIAAWACHTTSTIASRAYEYPLTGSVTATTQWNPAIGAVVTVTPPQSAVSYRANVIDSLFPVQDPAAPTLGRYEYKVIYDHSPADPADYPWKHLWTTVNGYVPIYSALPFVSSSAGNPPSGSISPH